MLRWGVLSTADIAEALLSSGSHQQFVAVASRDLRRAQAFARKWGIDRAYRSYQKLLADDEVEAIYNPLPNSMHADWTIQALEAGKHVLCEKPFSRRPEEVERAFAVAERQGLVLSEALMWRHHPQVARAQRMIEEGAVGRLRLVRAGFSYNGPDPTDIRLRAALDGGGLMDVGCYCVNGIRMLAGEPERVYAEYVVGGDGVDVALVATLRLPDDVLATLDCGLSYFGAGELEAVGDRGSLVLIDPWRARRPRMELRRPRQATEVEEFEGEAHDFYALELEDFAAAVRGKRAPLLSRADAVGQARTIAALHTSAERGEPVTLS